MAVAMNLMVVHAFVYYRRSRRLLGPPSQVPGVRSLLTAHMLGYRPTGHAEKLFDSNISYRQDRHPFGVLYASRLASVCRSRL